MLNLFEIQLYLFHIWHDKKKKKYGWTEIRQSCHTV